MKYTFSLFSIIFLFTQCPRKYEEEYSDPTIQFVLHNSHAHNIKALNQNYIMYGFSYYNYYDAVQHVDLPFDMNNNTCGFVFENTFNPSNPTQHDLYDTLIVTYTPAIVSIDDIFYVEIKNLKIKSHTFNNVVIDSIFENEKIYYSGKIIY